MSKRHLFISHKHISPDKDIAKVFGEFAEDRSNNAIDVHLSSDPKFGGPEVGGGLTDQLRSALSDSGVVLLIYTDADHDWSYCMWECGVATNPDTPATNIKVMQCTNDVPKPFASDVRVNARDYESVESFVRLFMTSKTFFPQGGAVTGFEKNASQVETEAKALFARLQKVLPPLDRPQPVTTTAWPYIEVEMDRDQIKRLKTMKPESREETACTELRAAHVVGHDQAEGVFGISFEPRQSVDELLKLWQEKHPDEEPEWFTALALQIADGARRLKEPEIRWRPLARSGDGAKFLLVMGRTCTYPDTGVMRFEVFFFVARPEAFVRDRMIPREQIHSFQAKEDALSGTSLDELTERMEGTQLSRMPFFGEGDEPRHIVHRSMVDRFTSEAARQGRDVKGLTVKDLLSDPALGAMFESTLAVVSEDATLDDAQRAMAAIEGCQDVFVTRSGQRDESVLGWITNTMIAN